MQLQSTLIFVVTLIADRHQYNSHKVVTLASWYWTELITPLTPLLDYADNNVASILNLAPRGATSSQVNIFDQVQYSRKLAARLDRL